MMKCKNCGKELTGNAYRLDKGTFGVRAINHFLEEFKFKKHIGYFCSLVCINGGRVKL